MNKWKTQTLQTTVLKLLLSSDSFFSKQQHYRFAESEWCCQTLSLSIRMTMITKLLTFITKISNNKNKIQLYYKTYTSIQSLPNFVPMKWSSNKEMKYSSQQYIIFNKTKYLLNLTFPEGNHRVPWLKSGHVSCYGTGQRTHCSSPPEIKIKSPGSVKKHSSHLLQQSVTVHISLTQSMKMVRVCLLYTSDAADER